MILEPWKYLADCNMLVIEDASSGRIRLASALGNAGQVFGFWRNCGGPGSESGDYRLQRMTHTAATIPIFVHSQYSSSVEFVPKRSSNSTQMTLFSLPKLDLSPFRALGLVG